MKATIEFDLPAEQDAFVDAVSGKKWKELVRGLQEMLHVMARTDESKERQAAYETMYRWLASERALAGLGLASNASLEAAWIKHSELWRDELDKHLEKEGHGHYMTKTDAGRPANDLNHSAHQRSAPNKKSAGSGPPNPKRPDDPADT